MVDYLIKVGQPEQAAPYVKKFLADNPDDATLLKVRDEYGVGSILRLSDYPATRPYAAALARRLADAAVRNATDPARIDRFVAIALADQRGAGPTRSTASARPARTPSRRSSPS